MVVQVGVKDVFLSPPWSPNSLLFTLITVSLNLYTLVYLLRSTVQGRSESSFVSSALPAGVAPLYRLECFVQVYDHLDAVSQASDYVYVSRRVNASEVQGFIRSQLQSSQGSNDATKSAISVGSAVLNAVDCNAALDCDFLKRHSCGRVKDTCGECLVGFLGDAGPRNLPCVNTTMGGGGGVGGGVCSVTTQCGGWETCIDGRCTVGEKDCPNNCSGHGDCLWRNINSHKAVLTCALNQASCEAVCQCGADYRGASCSISTATLVDRQIMRSLLLDSLAGNLTWQNLYAIVCN
ncbi:hypothetical protein B484DRAFT_196833 [Ochromonadaceae sp. CCMP2298]|nr:hypothetical protein B484DRAFT_196833 [Ochromonadaceae sp. CCMP2298]